MAMSKPRSPPLLGAEAEGQPEPRGYGSSDEPDYGDRITVDYGDSALDYGDRITVTVHSIRRHSCLRPVSQPDGITILSNRSTPLGLGTETPPSDPGMAALAAAG